MRKAKLGVDSGQMAVLAGPPARSGLAGHLATKAKAGRIYHAASLRDAKGRNLDLRVWCEDAPLPKWKDWGHVTAGFFTFNQDTQLYVCDPCYILDNHQDRTEYRNLIDGNTAGRILHSTQGRLLGFSCNTRYGDGWYPAALDEDANGYLLSVRVKFT